MTLDLHQKWQLILLTKVDLHTDYEVNQNFTKGVILLTSSDLRLTLASMKCYVQNTHEHRWIHMPHMT